MKKLKALYPGELLMRIKYFFRKLFGYYQYKKKPIKGKKIKNLRLVNLAFNTKINPGYQYDFLNNLIDIRNLSISNNNKKLWIYEDIKAYKDVKNIWEVNRLQFLVPLALNEDYKLIDDILFSWEENNKYNYGINYYSNLEVAIRALSIYLTFELTEGKIAFDTSNLLYNHSIKIYEEIDYSAKCMPNNHVLGEAACLLLLGAVFEENEWINKASKLIDEFSYLIDDEGISIEGSIGYHFFTVQILIIIYLISPSSMLKQKITKGLNFLKAVSKLDGSLPNLGDNDEGYFYNPLWIKGFNEFTKNLNFLNLDIKLENPKKKFYNYKDYKIIKNQEKGFYLLFNAQKQAYHSHADNLSIELTLGGKNILTDSGTYVYNNNPSKRSYFRSPAAHNTINLKGLHAMAIGTFRWIDPPQANIAVEAGKLIGMLTKGDNKFIREITYSEKKIVITDIINTNNNYEVNFHFAKDISLKKVKANSFYDNDLYIEILGDNLEILLSKSSLSEKYNKITERNNIKIKSKSNNKIITIIYINEVDKL